MNNNINNAIEIANYSDHYDEAQADEAEAEATTKRELIYDYQRQENAEIDPFDADKSTRRERNYRRNSNDEIIIENKNLLNDGMELSNNEIAVKLKDIINSPTNNGKNGNGRN